MKKNLTLCKKSILLFILALFNSYLSQGADYYWVGGTGEVNDYANHWATTSGGSTFQTAAPGMSDNLIFDVNSFTAPGQTVSETVLGQVDANDFICTGTLYPPTFDFNLQTTFIYGNFVLDSNVTWYAPMGNIYMNGTVSSNITLNTHGVQLADIQIVYPTGAGTISLGSDFSCRTFDMQGGIFYTNNYKMSTGSFSTSSASSPAEIHFGTSVVSCTGGFDATLSGSGLHADSCTLIMNQDAVTPFYCSNQNFNKVIMTQDFYYEGQLYGSHFTINDLEFVGNLLGGDFTIDSCHITKLIMGCPSGSWNFSQLDIDTLIFNNYTGSHIYFPSVNTDTLTVNSFLVINPGSYFDANTSVVIKKTSGQVCTDNIYLNNIQASGGAQFFAGLNSTDNGGNTGWQFIDCTPAVSNVWPGDANYDLVTDNLDLINVGLNFGISGAVRPSATNNWVAQPCPDWIGYFSNGANYKHADCNGDGTVDASDTVAISLNYGQTHPFRLAHENSTSSVGAELYFDLTGVAIVPGNTVTIPVKMGTVADTVNGLYGTGFTINYNPAYVDAQGVSVSFSNSWLSTGLMLTMAKDFPGTGQTDVSIVRTNHTDVSGSGIMAEITFTIPLSATGNFFLSFSNVEAIVSSSGEIPVNPEVIGSTTQVFYPSAGAAINFYPNPVIGSLHIAAEPFIYNKIIIKDITGRTVSTLPFETEIDFSSLQKGIYFVDVLSDNKLVARTKISHM